MSYRSKNLSVLAYANGFTLWHYTSIATAAILEGHKTQTRRVLVPQLEDNTPPVRINGQWRTSDASKPLEQIKVPYAPGDRLYLRESFAINGCGRRVKTKDYTGEAFALQRFEERLQYAATDEAPAIKENGDPYWWNLRPGIHMPKWASRLTLVVTDVRVQRLQEITEGDARAEGLEHRMDWCPQWRGNDALPWRSEFPRDAFKDLWDSLNAKRKDKHKNRLPYAWADDPWVVAVTFEAHQCNIDQMEKAA